MKSRRLLEVGGIVAVIVLAALVFLTAEGTIESSYYISQNIKWTKINRSVAYTVISVKGKDFLIVDN